MTTLESFKDFFRPINHRGWNARESSDLNSVGAVGGTRYDLPHEDDLVVPFFDRYGEIAQAGEAVFQLRQLVVVSGKQGSGTLRGGSMEVFDNCPGDG